ncbi:MAG: HTTM domain-containing protein [Deltaproteobacteria bacterium]|nr:HTTM domain-containing protein [Deltaproteobacteria bacterium]
MMQMETEEKRYVHPSGFVAFRTIFGCLLLFSLLRYAYNGWIDTQLLNPKFHFSYYYFQWVYPYSSTLIYGMFGVMIVCAFCIILGYRTRFSAALCCFCFTFVEIIDKSNYLNHYYLVSLLLFWLSCCPEVTKNTNKEYPAIHYSIYWIFRAQLAIVYIYAGLAKISWDWLVKGEPLYTWLQSFIAVPVFGLVCTKPWFAIAMSWGGAVFDLSIVPFLLYPKTRTYAFGVLVFFHMTLWFMFPIGIFPFVMIASATLFLDYKWASRYITLHGSSTSLSFSKLIQPLLKVMLVLQILFPLRHLLYSGPVNWTEEGFRFSWRVMLIEKTGTLEYEVHQNGNTFLVFPSRLLEPFQYKALVTQADMIQDYAYFLSKKYRNTDGSPAKVFAHSFIWFNRRKSQRFISADTDLATTQRGFYPKKWILPMDSPH